MTEGHKHRHVMVPSWDVWYVRLLRVQLIHRRDVEAVDKSPYPYGMCREKCPPGCQGRHGPCYALSPLGILHRWTGLTLEVQTEETLDCTYLDTEGLEE